MRKQSISQPKPKCKLEHHFYLIITIFVIGVGCNAYVLRQHEESGHHDKLHVIHDMKRMKKNHFMRHRQEKKNITSIKKKGLNHHQHNKVSQHHSSHTKQKSSIENTKRSRMLHNDILQTIDKKGLSTYGYGADEVWKEIIENGRDIMKQNSYKERLVAVEVGAQNEKQSLQALKSKFEVLCVEPSPLSSHRIESTMAKILNSGDYAAKKKYNYDNSDGMKEYFHLYNVAAGATSGGTLDFRATGGTGDHVGEIDMWNMKPGKVPDDWPKQKKGQIIQVQSVKLDDIIHDNKIKPNFSTSSTLPSIDSVYALKVDTQGFEPSVFSGLSKSLQEHKIKYIMTEYWPKGMGLMANHMDDPCSIAVTVLDTLTDAGYKLYALPTVSHPKAYDVSRTSVHHITNWRNRPLDDYRSDCQNFLDYEKRFPTPEYHMGYWTDILALAPGVEPFVPHNPSLEDIAKYEKRLGKEIKSTVT